MRTSNAWLNWRTALLLGLISSTFSTLISQFTAARIGRDAAVDWMVVAAIPLRDAALQTEPSGGVILAGILFHQWADISWVLVFFGLLGRWTAQLRPWTILAIAPFWALFTSALEWLLLVPLIPFWQPIFPLDQTYWIGLFVHVTSASMYPLFPHLRDWMAGDIPSPHRRFAALWSGAAAAGVLTLGMVAFLGWQNRELPHIGGNVAFDQDYMRHMSAHHAQGVKLAGIAAQGAADPHLRALARLMVAAQRGEIAIFEQWWRSWFRESLPAPAPEDLETMPGMLSAGQFEELRRAAPEHFDRLFVELMTHHHEGAIAMADEALKEAGDPRLRLMSHALRHQQRGQIALMHGAEGVSAVRAALSAMLGGEPAEAPDHEGRESH